MWRPVALACVGAVVVALAAGCGSSGQTPAAGVATTTPTSTAPAVAGVSVAMGEYFYRPRRVTVHVGEPVTFVNTGEITHTVADVGPAGRILSAQIKPHPLAPGARQTVVFRRPGLVRYLCTFHPTLMSGQIVVTR